MMAPLLPLQQFLQTSAKQSDALYLHQPVDGQVKSLSWSEVEDQARRVASFLLASGLKCGDKVGISSKNCAEWFIADIAIMMAGLISVPIYPTANSETIAHILRHSGCQTLFIGKLDDIKPIENNLSDIQTTIAFPYPTASCHHAWQEVLQCEPLQTLNDANGDDCLSIVYTSGSTGQAKGVVLSHNNLAAAASDAKTSLQATSKDRIMSYLPLAHITERGLIEMSSFYVGGQIFFVESLDTFLRDVKFASPNLFVSVPRLWSKFQAEILQTLPDKKLQFLLKLPLIKNLVQKKIRAALGFENVRLFGSGSAPISPAMLEWYHRIGIPISEGWGMTETSGLASVNIPFEYKALGSIGKPLNSIKMRLSGIQEIEISGAPVFSEYYHNEEATAENFSEDGWFKTGDMGSCDEFGNYRIVGRIKEQYKTSKGKYVAPSPIEKLLGKNTCIEQSCVIGEGRKQSLGLLVLNDSLSKEEAHSSLLELLSETNQQLESHERLDALVIVNDEWTIENNFLTPTLKIRRAHIESHYAFYLKDDALKGIIWS